MAEPTSSSDPIGAERRAYEAAVEQARLAPPTAASAVLARAEARLARTDERLNLMRAAATARAASGEAFQMWTSSTAVAEEAARRMHAEEDAVESASRYRHARHFVEVPVEQLRNRPGVTGGEPIVYGGVIGTIKGVDIELALLERGTVVALRAGGLPGTRVEIAADQLGEEKGGITLIRDLDAKLASLPGLIEEAEAGRSVLAAEIEDLRARLGRLTEAAAVAIAEPRRSEASFTMTVGAFTTNDRADAGRLIGQRVQRQVNEVARNSSRARLAAEVLAGRVGTLGEVPIQAAWRGDTVAAWVEGFRRTEVTARADTLGTPAGAELIEKLETQLAVHPDIAAAAAAKAAPASSFPGPAGARLDQRAENGVPAPIDDLPPTRRTGRREPDKAVVGR